MTSHSDDHPIPTTPDLQRLAAAGYPVTPPSLHPMAFGGMPWPAPGFPAADLSADLRSVRDALTTMSSKLDVIQRASDRVQQDHEVRLRALESRRWPLPAATVVIALAAAFIGAAAALLPLVTK